MGQTGSSALAEIVNKLGVPLYNHLKTTTKKYFENRLLVEENKRILSDEQEYELLDKPVSGEPRTDLKGLLKDPRLVLTYPLWKKAYPEAKTIFLARNTYDILLDKALYSKRPDLLKQRTEMFYHHINHCDDFLYLHYDMLTYDYEATLKKIADYCWICYKFVDNWKPKYYGNHREFIR